MAEDDSLAMSRLHRQVKRQRVATTTAARATATRTRAAAVAATTTRQAQRATTAAPAPGTIIVVYTTALPPGLVPAGGEAPSLVITATRVRPGAVSSATSLASSRQLRNLISVSTPIPVASISYPLPLASTSGGLVLAAGANAVDRSHLSIGAVVGIVAGGVAVIVGVLAVLSFCMIRARRRKQEEKGWWQAGVGPVPPGPGAQAKGESRTSLLGDRKGADTIYAGDDWTNEKSTPLPPLPSSSSHHPYNSRDHLQLNDDQSPARSPSLGKRLQGSLKRLGGQSLTRLGSKSSRSAGDDSSGRVSPFDVLGHGEKGAPDRPQRPPDELMLALALPDQPEDAHHSPLLRRPSSVRRKKDTIMGLTEAYGESFEESSAVPMPVSTAHPVTKRASIRDQVISRPSLDGPSGPQIRYSAPRPSLEQLKRGPSDPSRSAPVRSTSRQSRRTSVSNFAVSTSSDAASKDHQVWPRRSRELEQTGPVVPPPTLKRNKAPPAGLLGLGHPSAAPMLKPAAGPSSSRAPVRNLSPIREMDSRSVSEASVTAPLRVTSPLPNPREAPTVARQGYELRERHMSFHSSAGDVGELSPIKTEHFPVPPSQLPHTATFGPASTTPSQGLPSPFLQSLPTLAPPAASYDALSPISPNSPAPISPFVTGTARRFSVSMAPANLVATSSSPRPVLPPLPMPDPTISPELRQGGTNSSPVSPATSEGGAYGIGAMLLTESGGTMSGTPSMTATSTPALGGASSTPSSGFLATPPLSNVGRGEHGKTLGELAIEAQQPDYRSTTWSIYGLYESTGPKSPLLQGAFPSPALGPPTHTMTTTTAAR